MKKYFFSLLLGVFVISSIQSQIKIGNNPQNIDASSVLELESNSRVLVITRINDAQMNTITPLEGALVYNIDEECVFYYDGNVWVNLCEENIFNETFEVVGEDLVLTDSTGDSVSVPLSDLGVYTFTNDPVFNPVDNDNTIVITQTGDNVNLEVGEITGFNIVDSSINGFLDIQDGSIVNSKLQDDSVDRTKIDANVAGVGLTQAPDGSLDVDVTQITGTGTLSSTGTITVTGDPANSLFNNVGLDVADDAITNIKMADNSVGTSELINDGVTTDKILDASITNGKLDKPTIPISGFAPAVVDVDFGNNLLRGVVDPSLPTDAANKNYVDNAVGGLATLADGTIYIGDAASNAQELPITGDATLDNAGVLTIEPDAVTSAKILDGEINTADIAADAIDNTKIADDAINTENIADGQVQTTDILDDNVTPAKIEQGTNGQVLTTDGAGDVVWAAPAFSAVTTDATIDGDGNATALSLADNAVTTIKVLDDNITPAKIEEGTANQVLVTNAAGTDVEWTDRSNITTTGTAAGSIFFAAPTTFEPTEDNTQLFWDDTNNVLGIGTNTPDTSGNIRMQVSGSTRTGGLINSDGSANTPSYRFNSDPNTGMFWGGAADQLGFSVGGIEALRIRDEGTTDSELVVNGSLELTEQLLDENGATGNVGDVLIATATGTEWREPAVVAMGKANGAIDTKTNGASVSGSLGSYTVTFNTPRADADYIVQLTLIGGSNIIFVTGQTAGSFTVEIRDRNTNALTVAEWFFTVTDF